MTHEGGLVEALVLVVLALEAFLDLERFCETEELVALRRFTQPLAACSAGSRLEADYGSHAGVRLSCGNAPRQP